MKASCLPIQKPAAVRLSLTACHPSVSCLGWLAAKGCTEETGKVLPLEGTDLLLLQPICWERILLCQKKRRAGTRCSSRLFDHTVATEYKSRPSRGGKSYKRTNAHTHTHTSIPCQSGFHWCISILLHKLSKSGSLMLRYVVRLQNLTSAASSWPAMTGTSATEWQNSDPF